MNVTDRNTSKIHKNVLSIPPTEEPHTIPLLLLSWINLWTLNWFSDEIKGGKIKLKKKVPTKGNYEFLKSLVR